MVPEDPTATQRRFPAVLLPRNGTETLVLPELNPLLLCSTGLFVTVKVRALLAVPPTVTIRLPLVAPLGTCTTTPPLLQLSGVAGLPLNVTVLFPWLLPNPVPLIVTAVPTGPEAGDKLLIPSVGVKFTPLLTSPLTVTTTFPAVAPLGTGTEMLVLLQLDAAPTVPLKITVLVP